MWSTKFQSNNYKPMNSLTTLHHLIQHASQPRSPPIACQCLRGHASWRNQSMDILITSINSILPKYFKSQRAFAFNQFIFVNTHRIDCGFFSWKSHYNNNLYKQIEIQSILDTFGNDSHASWRIKLYSLIFGSQYVYIVYFANPNGHHVTLLQWRKYNYWMCITITIICCIILYVDCVVWCLFARA